MLLGAGLTSELKKGFSLVYSCSGYNDSCKELLAVLFDKL